MALVGILAPNPLWSALEQIGVPAANGYVFTFRTGTRIPQATYLNIACTLEQTNPIRLNSAGEAVIYWGADDDEMNPYPLYTIRIYADSGVDGVPGRLIYSTDNYPAIGTTVSGGDITTVSGVTNYARNEQFSFWSQGTSFASADLIAGDTPIADDWYYRRDNTSATISISRQEFDAGENTPPNTPVYYLEYECTAAAASTDNQIYQILDDVQTLNNNQITYGFWVRTRDPASTSNISIWLEQFFGDGGSLTFDETVSTTAITNTWTFVSTTFVVPTIAAAIIGDGSNLKLGIKFQNNQIVAVNITNIQNQPGVGTGSGNFPYNTLEDQFTRILAYDLSQYGVEQGTNLIASPAGPDAPDGPKLFNYLEYQPQQSALKGWYFPTNPNQMGADINSTSIYPNNHGAYIADCTILQSDGDNIVGKSSFTGETLNLEVITPAKKFGIGQILDPAVAGGLYNNNVSAFFTASSATLTGTMKYAIIGWSGAANMQTRIFAVSGDWEIAGTNPTLAPGWNYIEVGSLTLNTDGASGTINKATIPESTYSALGVFWWYDDLDAVAADVINFYYANLTKTGLACTNVIFEDPQETLFKCQKYFFKSYDASNPNFVFNNVSAAIGITLPNTFSPSGSGLPNPGSEYPAIPFSFAFPYSYSAGENAQFSVWTGNSYFNFCLPQPMAGVPTVTIYNANDSTSNSIYHHLDYTVGGSPFSIDSNGLAEGPYTVTNIGNQVVTIKIQEAGIIMSHPAANAPYPVTFNSNILSLFNIVADAQLGV